MKQASIVKYAHDTFFICTKNERENIFYLAKY